jgi:hypothetical protein
MWRSGAPQRRGARGAPQGRRSTYVLLYAVAQYCLPNAASILNYRLVAYSDQSLKADNPDWITVSRASSPERRLPLDRNPFIH